MSSSICPACRTRREGRDEVLISTATLARRWDFSVRTLEGWRRRGVGPKYIRVGSLIRYSLSEVESYEQSESMHPSEATE